MKCFLVGSNVATSPYPVYPLGMAMIANALIKAGHEVVQFDFMQSDSSYESLSEYIKREKPEIVGISMRNIDNVNYLNEEKYIDVVKSIVTHIKSLCNACVVLGGTAFSILPEKLLDEIGADYGIVGEGEKLMVELVNNIQNNNIPEKKVYKADSRLTSSQIPRPYYDKSIMDYYLENGSIANIQTKRGCIHKCTYCSYPYLEGHKFRPRNLNDVIEDIEFLINECNAKMLFFTDSVFNDEDGFYIAVLEEMAKKKIVIPWTAFIKPEKFSSPIMDLMIKTGVSGVEVGADGATDEALVGLGKSFRFKDVIECNKCFTELDIPSANYFMFGGPRETHDTVLRGTENIISLEDTVSFIFQGIRILPNTKIYDIAVNRGIIDKDDDLLDPKYYIEPCLDKEKLETTLKAQFKPYRHCVFPPDALDNSVKFLQKLGHKGLMWDLLIRGRKKKKKLKKKQ